MPTRKNAKFRVEQRRIDATKRQGECDKLTPEERIGRLDALFGGGLGAAKERKKLLKTRA